MVSHGRAYVTKAPISSITESQNDKDYEMVIDEENFEHVEIKEDGEF